MPALEVKQVLLSYEAPLVVVATDSRASLHVGVNYAEALSGYDFYFSRTKPSALRGFLDGTYDLLYLLTRKHSGKYHFGTGFGVKGEILTTKLADNLAPEVLPQPGVFMPSPAAEATTARRVVHIDGRWGINDLRKFSDLVQDCYAFVFALTGRGSQATKDKISALFQKYPWRGGYSAVNFFDDLYRHIPVGQRAAINSIQYASPGTIELRMNTEAATAIQRLCSKINANDESVVDAYKDVHDWLAERSWLGRSASDLRLSPSDRTELIGAVSRLAEAFGLASQKQYVLELGNSDPLAAVKILLAYYRRLEGLADYVATGKAGELFTKT